MGRLRFPDHDGQAGCTLPMKGRMVTCWVDPLARGVHVVSVYWVLLLAVLIFIDVVGRSFFNAPLLGTAEIIKNSVVSIALLQLPLAIYRGGMIRTTVIYDLVSPKWRRILRSCGSVLGLLLLAGIAYASWGSAIEAFKIGEYEGEGSLRVATWPVRFVVVAMSAFSAFIYLYLLMLDWAGRLENDDGEIVGV